MLPVVALWSHALAALLYGALAVFQLRRWNRDPLNRPLITAFATMSVWSVFLALLAPHHLFTALADNGRNLAFLAFMHGVMTAAGPGGRQRAVKAVYAAVAGVVGLRIVIAGIIHQHRDAPMLLASLLPTDQLLGLVFAAGALILVHNLYGQTEPASRAALKFPMLALAGLWTWDLHLHTVAYFTGGTAPGLLALRGVLLSLLVPLFAFGLRAESWKVQLSRAATFQSLSAVAILAYLVLMMSSARAMAVVGVDWGQAAQIALLVLMTAAAIPLLVSPRLRARARVIVAKHMFEHRYDYRAEWLRFTDTVRREGDGEALESRVLKALAGLGGCSGGLLLAADSHYRLSPVAAWNWDSSLPASADDAGALARFVEAHAWVLDFDALRAGRPTPDGRPLPAPDWLAAMDEVWAGVPLIHAERLVGLVLLRHPPFRRPLDWEDIDLFRAAGFQAASYIAEARSQQALADSRRFEEFNRRFAFILHDIKNLVSQLSLVSRNAERHADNPEFRADMVATLQSSVRKLNELMGRLSPGAAREASAPRPVNVHALCEGLAAGRGRAHPIRFEGDPHLLASADPASLEQALAHLVQNAIEASPPGVPVELSLFESGGDVVIELADRGGGMDEQFLRHRLFQPFVSTKESGFGIGAYEARALITAMGGRLEVESAPGEGTRFTIILPAAPAPAAPRQERIPA